MSDKFKAGDNVLYSADGRVGLITGKYREIGDKWQARESRLNVCSILHFNIGRKL